FDIKPVTVTMTPTPIAGTIAGASTVCVGSTIQLTVSGNSETGTWGSGTPSIASVNPSTGVVTGVSAGGPVTINYTVTNSCGTSNATFNVMVSPTSNAGSITGSSSVCVGSTINLSHTGDAGGVWSSISSSIASVNPSTGVVTGAGVGTTTIKYTVSTCGISEASYSVTVSASSLPGIVSGVNTICNGATTLYTSSGTPGGTWTSSNSGVASVNPTTGVVTGTGAGTAFIIYTVSSGGCGPASAQKSITVSSAGTITGSSTICVGVTVTFNSSVNGGNWSSSNPGVATVNANNGKVKGISAGTAVITYTTNSGCSSFTVTIVATANAGTVTGTSPLCIGATATYASNGDAGGTWNSSNPSVASVNSSTGFVTALSAGTTNITYTVSNPCGSPGSASKTLTVSPNVSAGTVSGTTPLCVGATAAYTKTGTAGGTWSSTFPSVATVNATTGLVTAVGAGTTDIIYTVNSGCGSPVSSFKTLTVSANASAGTVSGTTPLCIGATTTYTSNGTAGGTWSSSNPAVASVNSSSGFVTALSAGATNITYTVTSGCTPVSAFKTLNVSPNVNAGTVSGASTVCVGSTTAFTSNGTAGGSWTSSAPGVASVDINTGVITGVSLGGPVTITYTVSNSCSGPLTATKQITVTTCGPSVTCPSNISQNLTAGCSKSITVPNPTISNTTTLTWTMTGATVLSSPGTGINYVGIQTFNKGVTTVTYTATNGTSTTCSFTVTVIDNIAPTVTCPGNISQTLNGANKCSVSINVPNPTTGDNCAVTVVSWVMSGANNASSALTGINYVGTQTFNVGVTTITYTVKDAAGNTSTCSFTVTVINSKCQAANSMLTMTAKPKASQTVEVPDGLRIKVTPIPSDRFFTLTVQSSAKEVVDITVYDVSGKRLQQMRGSALQSYHFGDTYIAGTYFIEVRQGLQRVTAKLVKQ
ncbi:MAG: Ig-like domain-containing protein, partial [Flavobacterium sp.]